VGVHTQQKANKEVEYALTNIQNQIVLFLERLHTLLPNVILGKEIIAWW
jgi:hypothetical protein